jgi:hypothetical protein
MLKDIIPKAVGKVTSYIYDEDTLLFKKIEEIHNLVVFSGADIIAKAITGDTAYRLSTLYFEFDNVTLSPPPSYLTDRTADRSYYDFSAGTRDFLRVPLSGAPAMAASTVDYDGNQLTFFGMTSGSGQLGGAGTANYTNGVSSVIGVGLLASPTPLVQANDVLFARTYLTVPIQKEANKQVAISWDITFI